MMRLRSTRSVSPRKSPGVPSGLRVAGAFVLAEVASACGAEVCPPGTVEVSNSRSLWPRCVEMVVGETEMGTGGGACDKDGICDPDESLENCPEDCSVCGDGVVSGMEECDLGEGKNIGSSWMETEPSPDACAPGCKRAVWCGDGTVQGPEECDELPGGGVRGRPGVHRHGVRARGLRQRAGGERRLLADGADDAV